MTTMSAQREEDPLQAHRCTIEFGSQIEGLIISFEGIESKNEICEADGMGMGAKERPTSRIPGVLSLDPVDIQLFVLKGDTFFEDWFTQVQAGEIKEGTRNGSIILYDSLNEAVAEWKFEGAWPSKLAYSDLDSQSNDAMKLTVTLVYETFERVS
ncbi:MAG: phage tail protein [Candidatus Viridilinea halotolerans]|uniref:Phage tail protein n=1 Tax=Candidatus Viridilinea halotolerans TaxID=2491704 RepID=A0A426U1V7_9CHLR|nr:MAG: phage tail protein [Candidatus Viridilinea halotolerans]